LFLTACATRPSDTPPSPVDRPAPKGADPAICADLKPEPAPAGSILQSETPDEASAVGAFLTGEAAARDWGRQGWARAATAKANDCPSS
jgi:hypothetical protein